MKHLNRTTAKRATDFVGKTARTWGARIRRWPQPSLLVSVIGASLFGILIAWLAVLVLAPYLNIGSQRTAPIDLIRLGLTIAAGVGGVVALVVAYRRQLDIEQGRFVERFGSAAQQLGDTDVAIRIAGVYAMAGVADQSRGLKRQQCIDVLCGYVRLPFEPELGNNHQTQRTLRKQLTLSGGVAEESQFEYRQNDEAVRQTIVRVIATHLKKQSRISWSDCNFDFNGAHLANTDFSDIRFSGSSMSFEGATFSGNVNSFKGATFSGDSISFLGTTFRGKTTDFSATNFTGKYVNFTDANFGRETHFYGASFTSPARFSETKFDGDATFDFTTFKENIFFKNAQFYGNYTSFAEAKFNGSITDFGTAKFSGRTTLFIGAIFNDPTNAGNTSEISAVAIITNRGVTSFDGVVTNFGGAVFSGDDADFSGGIFNSHSTNFDETVFDSDRTNFGRASFSGEYINFNEAKFGGDETDFKAAIFDGIKTSFKQVDFGNGNVSFTDPQRWNPPPIFDWDTSFGDNISDSKPSNVKPDVWPPAEKDFDWSTEHNGRYNRRIIQL